MSPSTAAPRNPYKAPHTPPVSPLHLPGTPIRTPIRIPPALTDDYDFPESPSRTTYRRRPSRSSSRPSPTSDDERKKAKLTPVFRTIRRTIACVVVLGLLGVIASRTVRRRDEASSGLGGFRFGELKIEKRVEIDFDDPTCRFVSTVEAYHRDLKRLRHHVAAKKGVPLSSFPNSTDSDTIPTKHRHRFSSTGHLLVSDESGGESRPHPIPQLLLRGEQKWQDLLSSQSKTLGEAVLEYTRRYGRRPPRGFDVWWEFAMENALVLPDEYDRINLDLAPFFALPKKEMKRRMQMVEDMKETFTLVVQNGEVLIQIKDQGGLEWGGTWPRANDAASLVQTFADILPDLKATFSIFDQPQIYLSWARRGSLVDLGLRNLHTNNLREVDDGHVRLSRSCAPDSNFRMNPNFYEGKSFVYDTVESGDMCQNPYLVPLHGLTLEPHEKDSHPRPHTQLLPLFSLAKTSINSDILITPLDQFFDSPGQDHKWEEKRSSKLAWRGSPTGISMMTKDLPWRDAHRIRLHHFANNRSLSPTSYIVPDLGQGLGLDPNATASQRHTSSGESLSFGKEEMLTKVANNFFFDMKLAGDPIQCSEKDGTCEDMEREISWAPFQRADTLNRHKFLLDIDGNGWSGRFRRLMSTNSVVIKTGIFTEWFQPHLIPWFMYIPSKLDFTDLADILAFFRGTPKHPDLGFDETAKALARNGQCFVQRMFRIEDLQAYMMRLFLEYARIAADEGEDMDFYFEEDMLDEGEEQRIRVEAEHEAEQVVNRLSDEQLEALEKEMPDRPKLSHKSDLRGKGKAIAGVEDEDDWQAGVHDAALR